MVKYMNLLIYLFIFLSKIIENAIATLRLILVANGKKLLGAILNLIIAIIWIISTSLVVLDNNIYKIIVFAIGSFLGSYIGSLMEEKIAIGSNMLYIITDKINLIKEKLDSLNYSSYILNNNILVIIISRKERKQILNIIRQIDNNVVIISEVAKQLIFK